MARRVPMIVHVEVEGRVYSATRMTNVGSRANLRDDVGFSLARMARDMPFAEVEPLSLAPVVVDLRAAAEKLRGVDDELAARLLAHAEAIG